MRTLVVAAEYPWPANSGSRIRLATTLQALGRCGPVELFAIVGRTRSDFAQPPAPAPPLRTGRVPVDGESLLASLRRPARRGLPLLLPLHERRTVRTELAKFATGTYDLVWCFRAGAFVLSGEPSVAPTVVDLDDLEDHKILTRLSVTPPSHPGVPGRLLRRAGQKVWAEEARRWARLHRLVAESATTTVVCSDLDARRAALPSRVRVVPNSYPLPRPRSGASYKGSPPSVLFQGTLRYPPNADAARYLAEEIAPLLRQLVPGVRIRLVGVTSPSLADLDDAPGVRLVGPVADMAEELARCNLIAVPLRYGSGTRVKILEAFAHKVPVVSTTVGAEGLGVTPGVHLLIGDDAESFATACERIMRNSSLRSAIVEDAHNLYLDRYQPSVVQDRIRAVALEAAGV